MPKTHSSKKALRPKAASKRSRQKAPPLTRSALIFAAARGYEQVTNPAAKPWACHLTRAGFMKPDAETGDTLINFIAIEIGETYSARSSRDDKIAEAIRVLEKGKEDLDLAIDSLLALYLDGGRAA